MEFRLLSIFGHNLVHIWEHLRVYLRSESWKAECELKRWWRIAQVDSVNGFQTHSTILEVPLLLLARLQISGSLVWKWICLVQIWSPSHPIWWLCIIWNLRNKLAGLRDARVEIILIMESLIHLHWFCHNISNYMTNHGIWKSCCHCRCRIYSRPSSLQELLSELKISLWRLCFASWVINVYWPITIVQGNKGLLYSQGCILQVVLKRASDCGQLVFGDYIPWILAVSPATCSQPGSHYLPSHGPLVNHISANTRVVDLNISD